MDALPSTTKSPSAKLESNRQGPCTNDGQGPCNGRYPCLDPCYFDLRHLAPFLTDPSIWNPYPAPWQAYPWQADPCHSDPYVDHWLCADPCNSDTPHCIRHMEPCHMDRWLLDSMLDPNCFDLVLYKMPCLTLGPVPMLLLPDAAVSSSVVQPPGYHGTRSMHLPWCFGCVHLHFDINGQGIQFRRPC